MTSPVFLKGAIAFYLLLLIGCQSKIKSEQDLYKWLHKPENGLIKVKKVNDLQLTVKFLPPYFLAYKNQPGKKQITNITVPDSLVRKYNDSYTFVLSIGPAPESDGKDIMYMDVENYGNYKQRALELNFNLEEYIKLKVGSENIKPTSTILENTYGLTNGRNIYLVFNKPKDSREEELDFTFSDEFFGTGITHFVFNKSDLERLPKLNITE